MRIRKVEKWKEVVGTAAFGISRMKLEARGKGKEGSSAWRLKLEPMANVTVR